MARNVADVEKLLLCVFGIFRARFVGYALCLLGEGIADRGSNSETYQS
ncbi:hypothetical protein [Bradyrhizobium sp. UFLA03-84]|nr:hypothetical protein [Bradyrhizobium sp. UFLA03-84]